MDADARPDVVKAIYQRRAVRSYRSDKIDKETILELLDAAVQAPTAMHLEPWAFVVVQDKELLRRYSEQAKAMLLERDRAADSMVHLAGPHSLGLLAMLSDPAFNIFYDAGTLIVICRKSAGVFADADCWLAAENLMLAATAKGLGSCCIGFALPVLNQTEVKRELGIPDDGAAVASIIVGVPNAMPATVGRKAAEVLSWR